MFFWLALNGLFRFSPLPIKNFALLFALNGKGFSVLLVCHFDIELSPFFHMWLIHPVVSQASRSIGRNPREQRHRQPKRSEDIITSKKLRSHSKIANQPAMLLPAISTQARPQRFPSTIHARNSETPVEKQNVEPG